MEKIQERLNLPQEADYPTARRELILAWRSMAQLVNNLVTIYYQDDMPVIPLNTTSLWIDTDAVPTKYYQISNFGGTMKKVEMT